MTSKYRTSLVLAAALITPACGWIHGDATSTFSQGVADAGEAVISSLNGIADDQAKSPFAMRESFSFFHEAFAASCMNRVGASSCVSSVREATFTNCDVGTSGLVLNGSARLDYFEVNSAPLCDLTINESVTRTMNLTYTATDGTVVTTTSNSYLDYRGKTYAGGTRLLRGAAGFELLVLGITRARVAKGATLSTLSVQTTASARVTNSLSRGSRVLNGGVFEVSDSTRHVRIDAVPKDLTWGETGCCLPTSGSLSFTYKSSNSGELEAPATMTFQSCGVALLEQGDTSQQVTLASCE